MKKVVISGMLGNGLEWYDFAIYGLLAPMLGPLFFPSESAFASQLGVFGVFAVGFLFRPLGAILFGWMGDRYGRKVSLVVAILMMAIPTGLMGMLPTYAQVGVLAPILLTLLRVFQGLSLGGEFSGSIIYIVEHAPPHRRALAGSASLVSLGLGFIIGTFTVIAVKSSMNTAAFEAWGWRVPFLCGIVVGLVGFYIRSKCHESPLYARAKSSGDISPTPLVEAFKMFPKPMLQGFGMYIAVTMPFYLMSVYMISFMTLSLMQSFTNALIVNMAVMSTMLVGMLIGAVTADRVGRKAVMLPAVILMTIMAMPMFIWMDSKIFIHILFAQIMFSMVLGIYIGPIAAVLVELFPTRVRYSGMALTYNAAAALFGGSAPLVCRWLIESTGTHLSIAWYVMFCCACAFVALLSYHDRWKEPLR